MRVLNVDEAENESTQDVIIQKLKDEINVEIKPEEIDIVHRLGRQQAGKHRAILIKFLSHKSKEKVMRKKKEAQDIKIFEDLAPGIKRMFDSLNVNRIPLNIDSLWTIDGRIKFKHFNSNRIFEIRSFSDYNGLMGAYYMGSG